MMMDFGAAAIALGIALASLGRTEEAARQVEHALRLEPDLPGAAEFLERLRSGGLRSF